MNRQPLFKAFGHAFNGLSRFIRTDRNGRIHFSISLLVCIAGFYFRISHTEWMLLLLCFPVVLGLEMMNHAIEKLCDTVHPGQHPYIKTVKDVAAAGVLFASIIASVIGCIVFIPKILLLV